MTDPFHEGERAVQELTGEREQAARLGRMIADRIPLAAQSFICEQTYCIFGWVASDDEIWSQFIGGQKGFCRSTPDGASLEIKFGTASGATHTVSPFLELSDGGEIGVLFIDFATRRRLRVNGRVDERSDSRVTIAVHQSFPNCPKYIQRRELSPQAMTDSMVRAQVGDNVTDEIDSLIKAADTFFVASAFPGGPTDVSHRGGKPGFVRVNDGVVRIPDYPGNSMFGTLGNFATNPRAGLVFVDFEQNRQLQMTGDVWLDLGAGETFAGETGGTGRWWEFWVRKWQMTPLNPSFQCAEIEMSPFNP